MIIDAHTHLGNPGGAIVATPEDLIKSMDKAGIDKSVILAGNINKLSNKQVLAAANAHPDRLIPVGSYSEEDLEVRWAVQRVEELLAEGKIRGLKFYPGYEPYAPSAPWLQPLLELLVKYNRPAIFHSGDLYNKVKGAKLKYALPLHLDDVAVDHPDLKIIVAHLGFPWQREAAEVCYKNKNVYSDCSGFVYGDFSSSDAEKYSKVWNEFVAIAGDDRILFGSDWPISGQESYLQTVTNLVSDSSRDLVFGGNANALFGV